MMKYIVIALLILSPWSLVAPDECERACRIVKTRPFAEWPAVAIGWPLVVATILIMLFSFLS